ncbi:MAG: NADH:ubiquinone reductase (Na(+)-transporting) subunit D [Verrucomicrobia bacterium]|nr:NADH:ubiquinone reductase (Na(+)-transporting) subunit D [Verrucomicrobiota bacterium]
MAKVKDILIDPVSKNNPITYQILGVCSALAVTSKVQTSFVMAVALTLVVTGSNLVISLMRKMIPSKIRMIVELSVISTLVILVDQVLKATAYDVSKQLSVFVGLIITNCIVMGRAEAFALQNPPKESVLDGIGNGLGYSAILLIVGTIREIFGSGTWAGLKVMPDAYANNGLMLLPPSAFLIIGMLIWAQRTWMTKVFEED